MNPTYRCFDSPDELGAEAAEMIAAGIAAAGAADRSYLLGCPGGRTPKPIYDALGERCALTGLDCSHVVIVMMDDYVEQHAGHFRPVPADVGHSCRRFAEFDIRQVINVGLPEQAVIPPESVWFPDPDAPHAFDRRLADAGGVDLFLLASGASDGHVAFCGPGSDIDGVSSIVTLATTTRQDNTATFANLTKVDDVPTHGVTVGLGTIRHSSRSVLMVLHGADKRESLRRIRDATSADPDWPATFVHECDHAMVWFDTRADQPDRSNS
jgi:glucosamine-6-phosphate deaminase